MKEQSSTAPLWWLLFSAGGVVAAMLMPVAIAITGIAVLDGDVLVVQSELGRGTPRRNTQRELERVGVSADHPIDDVDLLERGRDRRLPVGRRSDIDLGSLP
jgi:hypothetical protein